MAVANITGESVTIFSHGSDTVTIDTALAPRRIAVADINGNGWSDVATANQGDTQVTGNPDVSIVYTPVDGDIVAPAPSLPQPLGTALGMRLRHASGLSTTNPNTVWSLEGDGSAIQAFNPSASLNSNLNARFGQRVEFPFVAGGFCFVTANTGWVVERDAARLHRFTLAQGAIQQTITLPVTPGSLGFRGMERLGQNGDFILSDPANRRVIRVTAAGALVAEATTPLYIHDIARDASNGRLYFSHPGTTRILAYSEGLVPQPQHDLLFDGGGLAYLQKNGISGITPRPNQPGFFIMDRNRLVLRTTGALQIDNDTAISPVSNTLAIAADHENDRLWFLGSDLHLAKTKLSDLSDGALYSLRDLLDEDPVFIPAGIAWDNATDALLISDKNRPLIARLSTNGSFQEMVSFTLPSGHDPITGTIALDKTHQRIFFRTGLGAWSVSLEDGAKSAPTFIPLPAAYSQFVFAAANGYLLSGTLDPSLHVISQWLGGEASLFIRLPANGARQTLSLADDGSLLVYDEANGGALVNYPIEFPEETRVGDWLLLAVDE